MNGYLPPYGRFRENRNLVELTGIADEVEWSVWMNKTSAESISPLFVRVSFTDQETALF